MVIGFFAPDLNKSAWKTAFSESVEDFRVWPDWGNHQEIDYVLVWQPTKELFKKCDNLKAIFSLGAGVDHLLRIKHDLPKDVPIVRMADSGLVGFMASFVVMSVLFHHRSMLEYAKQQREKTWQPLDPVSPDERCVGFLGLGNMVLKPADVLRDLGHTIVTWSRTEKQIPGMVSYWGMSQLEAFLSRTDILVCALPATEATDGLLDNNRMSKLPRGAAIINVGRGNVIVVEDLLNLLDSGHLSGAILDVFNEEPLPGSSRVWDHEKIIVTPHVASPSLPLSVADYTLTVINDFEKGNALPNVVDLDLGY